MESITIKVEENLAKEIASAMEPDYSTKTEFIREAVRDKIKEIRKEKALYDLRKLLGSAKPRSRMTKQEKEMIAKMHTLKRAKEIAKKYGF